MKKIKLYSVLFASIAMVVLGMTSCNDSSYSRALTPEQIKTAYFTVRGTHTGKMYFLKEAPNDNMNSESQKAETDSVDISWTIDTDSTMIIHDFPTHAFAEFVTDDEMKEALLQQPNQDIKCQTAYWNLSPICFYVGVVAPTYNITYGGKEHKVQLVFYTGADFYGIFDNATKYMNINLMAGGLYIDDEPQASATKTTNIPFLLVKK